MTANVRQTRIYPFIITRHPPDGPSRDCASQKKVEEKIIESEKTFFFRKGENGGNRKFLPIQEEKVFWQMTGCGLFILLHKMLSR